MIEELPMEEEKEGSSLALLIFKKNQERLDLIEKQVELLSTLLTQQSAKRVRFLSENEPLASE